ncbi:MAG: amidohydrolase [Aquificaceae bacterium]|nr:MAG: amidohydrolase [Aquificaceae bacterium]
MPKTYINSDLQQCMITWRHWLHQHPELAFKEETTSDYIANALVDMGYEIERGWATTGIVATLKGQQEGRSIALRADIDALPLTEKNHIPHKSLHDGKMHACGHDGHTTMLLGAAAHLKENNNFAGTVHFIFQPAEEAFGGARVMVEEGLFDRFPCDAVFGMHNWPGLPAGEFAVHNKEVMSAVDTIYISVKGKGGHAAMPDQIIDPIVTSAQLITALQSVVSRNVSPLASAVVSITQVNGGHAANVIPDEIKLVGTLRYFDNAVGDKVKKRIKKVVKHTCKSMGAKGKVQFEAGYPATINTPKHAKQCAIAAVSLVGKNKVHRDMPPSMGAEDFSYMLNASQGAYIWIGNGEGEGGCMLHNSQYDFNDDILPLGASYWVKLVTDYL